MFSGLLQSLQERKGFYFLGRYFNLNFYKESGTFGFSSCVLPPLLPFIRETVVNLQRLFLGVVWNTRWVDIVKKRRMEKTKLVS